MTKISNSFKNLFTKLPFFHTRRNKTDVFKRKLFCEPLEARELLTIMHWVGTAGKTWNSPDAWTIDLVHRIPFQAGADAKFDQAGDIILKQVAISGNVQPASIEFGQDGYTLTGGTISANAGGNLTITVDHGETEDKAAYVATISSTITDPSGGTTHLTVPASSATDGTGVLKLDGVNTYTGGTAVTGGKLQAVKPASLPSSVGAPDYVFRPVTVNNSGSLIVEAEKDAAQQDLDWSSAAISRLLNDSPTTFAANTNLGISVDSGTSFEYSGSIPGGSYGQENFVKMDTGMLTLSGTNQYAGKTTIAKGTRVASIALLSGVL